MPPPCPSLLTSSRARKRRVSQVESSGEEFRALTKIYELFAYAPLIGSTSKIALEFLFIFLLKTKAPGEKHWLTNHASRGNQPTLSDSISLILHLMTNEVCTAKRPCLSRFIFFRRRMFALTKLYHAEETRKEFFFAATFIARIFVVAGKLAEIYCLDLGGNEMRSRIRN